MTKVDGNYKWALLGLSGLTNALAVAAPSMSVPVLLPEITRTLDLTLVQAGLVWGISALPAVIIGVFGGALGDRFGSKRVLTVSCVLVGLAGAMRGLAGDFTSLMAMVFLFGLLTPLIIMSNIKTAGIWFSSRELGFANGVLSMGMALGFLVGSTISASLLSPWLGGWRNVFFFFGVISAAFAIPWYFSRSAPSQVGPALERAAAPSLLASMTHVAKLRNLWLLGLAVMGISGGIQGLLGYLPLHLRAMGWTEVNADAALGAFHTVSMLSVLPIALWSDRLGSRKTVLIGTAVLIAVGIGLLSFTQGSAVWAAVILAGVVRDGFMAIFLTTVAETRGIGLAYTGTATGFIMVFIGLGSLLAPPLGNALAAQAAGAPFLLWSALSLFGIVCISLTA
jgi:NNP family nitrate/nitrite transporter-like MFS transporter